MGPSRSPVAPPSSTTAEGFFQCGFCKKHYNRADHLIRHVRSHTREKPYACHVCNKGFSRPDLMKRHAAAHEGNGLRKVRSSVDKNVRVSQACKSCAAAKLKCDEDKPCRRCREKDIICDGATQESAPTQEFAPTQESAPIHEVALTEPSRQQGQGSGSGSSLSGLDYQDSGYGTTMPAVHDSPATSPLAPPLMNTYPTPVQSQAQYNSTDSPIDGCYTMTGQLPPYEVDSAISPTGPESGIFSIDGTFFPDFIPGSLPPSLSRLNEMDPTLILPPDYTHMHFGGFNTVNLQPDFDLTDVDYGLLESFNTNGVNQGIHSNAESADDPDSQIALGVEAFHRSSLSAWEPDHRDHAFADQENLSVPKAIIDSPESNISCDYQILGERLLPSSRDAIFGMVLYTSERGSMTRIIKSFPSTELLDGFMQNYFNFQRQQVHSFIHCPTFQPNSEGPEILTALAAAGATLSPIWTIRKLGYALMEIGRLRLPAMYETDNSITRDLRASQTYALVIDVGLWSGNARKTEIAESSVQNLVTMLRRALRFRRSRYPPIVPTLSDTGHELERKWHSWVEQESFKRLVYHVFLHDSQAAMTLHINPLVSYADLELPLPELRELWEAKSALEWKEIYLSRGPIETDHLPSLADLLQDMSQLRTFQSRIDTQAAAFILLHGISALIMEYQNLKFISKGPQCKHWHALVINSRHQELCAALQHFRTVCSALDNKPRQEIRLICEATSMFLYTSLEDLQLFAGKEDKNEARRVYHAALEWINSVDSRRAIWHAGQAVRAAKAITPAASLRGFLAITVYHASLAFWSYSVVSKSRSKSRSKSKAHYIVDAEPRSTGIPVFLDAEETPDVERFISLGYGDPALQGFNGELSLVAEANTTMHVILGVLRRDAPNEALQPLVLSLCRLMRDLGNAAGGNENSSKNHNGHGHVQEDAVM